MRVGDVKARLDTEDVKRHLRISRVRDEANISGCGQDSYRLATHSIAAMSCFDSVSNYVLLFLSKRRLDLFWGG